MYKLKYFIIFIFALCSNIAFAQNEKFSAQFTYNLGRNTNVTTCKALSISAQYHTGEKAAFYGIETDLMPKLGVYEFTPAIGASNLYYNKNWFIQCCAKPFGIHYNKNINKCFMTAGLKISAGVSLDKKRNNRFFNRYSRVYV